MSHISASINVIPTSQPLHTLSTKSPSQTLIIFIRTHTNHDIYTEDARHSSSEIQEGNVPRNPDPSPRHREPINMAWGTMYAITCKDNSQCNRSIKIYLHVIPAITSSATLLSIHLNCTLVYMPHPEIKLAPVHGSVTHPRSYHKTTVCNQRKHHTQPYSAFT